MPDTVYFSLTVHPADAVKLVAEITGDSEEYVSRHVSRRDGGMWFTGLVDQDGLSPNGWLNLSFDSWHYWSALMQSGNLRFAGRNGAEYHTEEMAYVCDGGPFGCREAPTAGGGLAAHLDSEGLPQPPSLNEKMFNQARKNVAEMRGEDFFFDSSSYAFDGGARDYERELLLASHRAVRDKLEGLEKQVHEHRFGQLIRPFSEREMLTPLEVAYLLEMDARTVESLCYRFWGLVREEVQKQRLLRTHRRLALITEPVTLEEAVERVTEVARRELLQLPLLSPEREVLRKCIDCLEEEFGFVAGETLEG